MKRVWLFSKDEDGQDRAVKRKVVMIAQQKKRATQLKSLCALVQKKEEEVSYLSAAGIHPSPDNHLPSFAICSRPRGLIKHLTMCSEE